MVFFLCSNFFSFAGDAGAAVFCSFVSLRQFIVDIKVGV